MKAQPPVPMSALVTAENIIEKVTQTFVEAWKAARIENLTEEQFVEIGKRAVIQRLTDEMNDHLRTASEDVNRLVAEFLQSLRSKETRKLYQGGLQKWLDWCRDQGIHPLRARVRDADLFAASAEGAPTMVNHAIAAASSWYTRLMRHEIISRTPFQGVTRRTWRPKLAQIPESAEVEAILGFIRTFRPRKRHEIIIPNETLHAACYAMAHRGFRVDVLSRLEIDGTRFRAVSKNKNWVGDLLGAAEVLQPLGRRPFKDFTKYQFSNTIRTRTRIMVEEGLLRHAFSAHSFRHYFASMEYIQSKDIERVRKLLNHSKIETTIRYLHDLGLTVGV